MDARWSASGRCAEGLSPVRRRLCGISDLRETDSKGFAMHDGAPGVFVVRQGKQIRVWRDACPHVHGAPLAWRRDAYLSADGSQIVCHAHGARFEPHDGRCVVGPALGEALTPVPWVTDAEGGIWIDE